MPKFHGHDYYCMAITDHAAGLNKALLTVPQSLLKHGNNCCINLLNILDFQSREVEAFSDNLEADCRNLDGTVQLFQDLQDETVESYQKDVIIGHDGNELLEIIPSSNPESSCSLDASLLEESILKCGEVTCIEKFAAIKSYTDSIQPFDEPLSVDHCRLAVQALPSISILLLRLKLLDLEDPLLKFDGSKWMENDILGIDHSQHEYSIDDSKHKNDTEDSKHENDIDDLNVDGELILIKETFDTFLWEAIDEVSSELLLPYIVPDFGSETYPGHIFNFDYVGEVIEIGVNSRDDHSFLDNFDSIKSKLTTGLSMPDMTYTLSEDLTYDQDRNTTSFITINNIGFPSQSPSESCGDIPKCLSPFLEYSVVEIVDDNERVPLCLPLAQLETLTGEDGLLTKCAFIDEDIKHMERHIWQQSKHFDEIQLPEPIFTQENLPDPVVEVSAYLRLVPEETELHDDIIQWSFDQLDTPSFLSGVEILDNNICIHQLEDAENFDKFETAELDFISISTRDKGKDKFVNEITQDKTGDCVDLRAENVNKQEIDMNKQEKAQSLNPLDSFIQLRDVQKRRQKHNISDCTAKNQQENGLTLTTTVPQSSKQQCTSNKTLQAIFCGPWEMAMQCIIDGAAVHLGVIKQEALVPSHQQLLDISIDITRFLLKEIEKQISDVTPIITDSHISCTHRETLLQSLTAVHLLRTAADLLLNACFESCISYLVTNIEDGRSRLGRSCDEVHKQLFQYQCQFLQKNITHPKLNLLSHEVGTYSAQFPGCKILILVQKGLNNLVAAIQMVLGTVSNLTIAVVKSWKCVDDFQRIPKTTTAFVATMVEAWTDNISHFNLVIQYDEQQSPNMKSSCQDKGISYIGFITQHEYHVDNKDKDKLQVDKTDVLEKLSAITVICSEEVTCHKELVCLLEARYNVMVIEREYTKLFKSNINIYFADLIVSVTDCIVLLSLEDMKKQWDLTATMKRLVALGLQFSYCYIILHGMNAGNSYVIEKETLSNIYKLTAALYNLRGASLSFDSIYKVVVSQRDEDVASRIRSIVEISLKSNSELDSLRPWLSADASQDEVMLLQMNCLNSFSTQILLNRLPVDEIVKKSDTELIAAFPDIPERILKYMHYMISSSVHQQPCLANTSQVCHDGNLGSSMVSQANSTLSSTVSVNQNQTAVSEYDFKVKVSHPDTQTMRHQHEALGIEESDCLQPSIFRKSNNLTELERYSSYTMEPNLSDVSRLKFMHRGTLLQQQGCSDSMLHTNSNSILQSLQVSERTNDQQCYDEDTSKPKYVRYTSYSPDYSQDNLAYICRSRYTGGAQVNDDFQQISHDPVQRKSNILPESSNIPTSSCFSFSTTYQSPSHLESSVQHHVNYQSNHLQKNGISREPHNYTLDQPQWQTSSYKFDSCVGLNFNHTSDDKTDMPYFHPELTKAMQTLDMKVEACDENQRSITLKQTTYPNFNSKPHRNYSPYTRREKDHRNVLDYHEVDPSPFRIRQESLWNVGDHSERSTAKECLLFNFSPSKNSQEHKPTQHSRFSAFYNPVAREIEDKFSDDNFKFIGEFNRSNILETSLQKSTNCLSHDDRLQSREGQNCEDRHAENNNYNSCNSNINFLGSSAGLSFNLHKNGITSECTSDPDTEDKEQGFGIFSSRAQRQSPTIVPTLSDGGSDLPNINTIRTTVERDRFRSLIGDAPGLHLSKFSLASLPIDIASDKTKVNPLPFSVSKELKRHLTNLENSSYESQNHVKSFLKRNLNSVRVSRQPDFCNGNNNRNNYNDSKSYVHDQVGMEHTIQHEFQEETRDTESTRSGEVHQATTRCSNPICFKDGCSCELKFGGYVQPSRSGSNKYDNIQFNPLHQKDFNRSLNEITSTYDDHRRLVNLRNIDYSSSNCPPDFIKNVTMLSQQCQPKPTSNCGAVPPDTIRCVQRIQNSSIPYTPRHRIAVGLAQPFPRQVNTVEPGGNVSTRSPSHESARQQPDSRIPPPRNTNVTSESPPMDLLLEEDTDKYRKCETETQYNRSASKVKIERWNKHLLSYTSRTEDQPRLTNSNASATNYNPRADCLSSMRKRKLKLEKGHVTTVRLF